MKAEKNSKTAAASKTAASNGKAAAANNKAVAALHIGKLVRKHLEELGMTKSEFARRLDTSPQNIYGIFKRKSIDTELLKSIGSILNFDFFQYYGSGALYVNEDRPTYGKEKVLTALDLQRELDRLKKEHETLKQENNYLKEIVQLMKDKQSKK